MKSSKDTQTKSKNNLKPLFISILLVALAVLIWYLITPYVTNRAQEVARPLETALVAQGAVKVCSSSKAGRGPDDRTPGYNAYYQLNVGKDQAIEIINKAAKDNGYSLTHLDSTYGSIDWFNDDTSKDSTYSDLEPGKIKMSIGLYSNTDEQPLICQGGAGLKGNKDQTAVSLGVALPLTK